MSNVIRFTHPRQTREEVREQASLWLTRMDAGLGLEERRQLGEWLKDDPLHAELLMEMARLWDQMSVLSGLSDIFPLEHYGPPGRKKPRRRLLLAALGTALLSVPAARLLLDSRGSAGGIPETRTYETAIGEQSTVNLPDDSVIVLNTDTRVELRYGADERRVLLRRGEALFTVASDPGRPFRVYAGGRMVEAVGTAFSMHRTREGEVEVLVTEGKVKFLLNAPADAAAPSELSGAGPGALSLEAGEYLLSADRQASVPPEKVRMEPAEMEVALAWSQGGLMFRDEPLERVLEEFSRYTTIRFETDPAIRDRRVVGYFPIGNIETLLSSLRLNLQIDAERRGENLIFLTPRQ